MYAFCRNRCIASALIATAAAIAPIHATAQLIDCSEPGCNWADVAIPLTANQPTYWSVATGQPANGGVSPFTVLDPGDPPGRPALDGTDERVLRGYIVAWAVNAAGEEIRWNHLKGDALIIHYEKGAAWEYNAFAFQLVNPLVGHGQPSLPAGELRLDGSEYDNAYDLLLLDFYASYEFPFFLNTGSTIDSDLTLLPLHLDLRQETDGPVTTKASFTVWNQNEVKLTGLDRCVTCWDQTLLSQYGVPNHFLIENLQTSKGKAHIDGLASQLCDRDFDPGDGLALGADPRDVVSVDAALIGVVATDIEFGPYGTSDYAGMNLTGMGVQAGLLLADVASGPHPERPTGSATGSSLPDSRRARTQRTLPGQAPSRPDEPVALGPDDRGSASEKGSLLIFPNVELRWDAAGNTLIQDTFIDLTNDYPGDVLVQMYFVNGDHPFNPGPSDANSNGVPDDCEDRLRWSCNILRNDTGDCQVDPAGPFASLAECEQNCTLRYTCAYISRGIGGEPQCLPHPQGEYATLADCQAGCGQRYSCVGNGDRSAGPTGDQFCAIDSNGIFERLTYCLEECGPPRYDCYVDEISGQSVGCVQSPLGSYATPDECEQNCGASRYTCGHFARGAVGPTCLPDSCGEYASFVDCVNSCGVRTYTCADDSRSNGDGCVVAAGSQGEFDTLLECAFSGSCPTNTRYNCVLTKGGTTCVPNESGQYENQETCERCCADTPFSCNINVRSSSAECVPDRWGEFASLDACNDDCVLMYSCEDETTGGFCVLDPFGPYTEDECLNNVCNTSRAGEAAGSTAK